MNVWTMNIFLVGDTLNCDSEVYCSCPYRDGLVPLDNRRFLCYNSVRVKVTFVFELVGSLNDGVKTVLEKKSNITLTTLNHSQ